MRGLFVALLGLAMLAGGGTALAITYGEPDGTAHPHVGLVVFYDSSGAPLHRCSGTLLSSTVFLTAGHCTAGTASAQVWFQPLVTTALGFPLSGGVTGTPFTHPNFDNFATFPNSSDVGIVVLDQKVKSPIYGILPALGYLDTLKKSSANFTVVGYGVQEVKPDFQSDRERFRGTVQLVNLESALTDGFNMQFTSDPGNGTGSGGICFGDSGGPTFDQDTNVVVGVSSFVKNKNCKGSGYSYRTDIANSQGFINTFLR